MDKKLWNDNWLFWNSKDAFALVWDIPEMARKIQLPHDAMLENEAYEESLNGSNTGFYDGGSYTYVKLFESKPGDRQKNMMLRFDGVYMNTFVYVNGQLAANRPYGYSQFYVPISHLLKEQGENEIRVQVRNGAMANSRWYSGSGIYRDVYMLTSGTTYIHEDGPKVVTEECDEDSATIKVSADIVNKNFDSKEVEFTVAIYDANNNEVAKDTGIVYVKGNNNKQFLSRINIANPCLWSEDTPEIYTAKVSISVDNEAVDSDEATFGIRKLSLDAAHGLRVNGKEVKLRGACIHHDNGVLGAKTYYEAEYRRVKILKESGFNAIRMSHHPASPALLRACDELGVYVMDETFDMWTRAKSDYDYNLFFTDWWKKDVEAMVAKDFNHPSVILYSIGNEIPEIGTNEGSSLAAEISDLCHELDGTRYTLAAINGVFAAGDAVGKITADVAGEVKDQDDSVNVNDFMTIMDKYMDRIVVHEEITKVLKKACVATDIAGYNYMTARYAIDVENEPNRVMVGSETYPPEIAVNWREVNKYPQVIGDFTWTGWDYLGEAGVGIPAYNWGEGGFGAHFPAKLAYTGDIDITGYRRPLSYYREIVFGRRTAPYIAVQNPAHYGENLIKTPWVMSDAISSWTYEGYENKSVIVEVYAAGDEVELFLNDESLGRKTLSENDNCRVLFETKYAKGVLKAVSYKNNQVQGEYTLKTVESNKLHVSFDTNVPKESEIAYVNITVGEDAQIVNSDSIVKLSVEIEGDGELIGLGSGNPKAQESYLGKTVSTWNGRALAVVKKGKEKTLLKVSTEDGYFTELTI